MSLSPHCIVLALAATLSTVSAHAQADTTVFTLRGVSAAPVRVVITNAQGQRGVGMSVSASAVEMRADTVIVQAPARFTITSFPLDVVFSALDGSTDIELEFEQLGARGRSTYWATGPRIHMSQPAGAESRTISADRVRSYTP